MIIGISGRIGSGKDTVGKIIQILAQGVDDNTITISHCTNMQINGLDWEIKKFADKLKDIVCILINCNREQLEDHDFKNKELGEKWWKYTYTRPNTNKVFKYFATAEEAHECMKSFNGLGYVGCIYPTPRMLLQLLGTECGRDIIHPDIWTNTLFNDYKKITTKWNCDGEATTNEYPKWIITDLRFPNEMKAVKKHNGITIKVTKPTCETADKLLHYSETALDDANFDYEINNNGSLEDLIGKVKEILIKEKII